MPNETHNSFVVLRESIESLSPSPSTASEGSTFAIDIAPILGVSPEAVSADIEKQKALQRFCKALNEEHPELAWAMLHLNNPSDLLKLPEESRTVFVDFCIKHQKRLKAIFGYATTATPLFFQYLFPPFVSIHDRDLAIAFASSGTFVNVALTGMIAGPVFTDAIGSCLSFISSCRKEGPKAATQKLMESLWPEEWTAKAARAVEARGKDAGYGSCTLALQQVLRVCLPLLRLGFQGVTTYGSFLLSKALAQGALDAEASADVDIGQTSAEMNFIYYWIIATNTVLYARDVNATIAKYVRLPKSEDQIQAEWVRKEIEKIDFMHVKAEIKTVKTELSAWLIRGQQEFLASAEHFKTQFNALDFSIDTFAANFEILISNIIKNDRKTVHADPTKTVRLNPDVLMKLAEKLIKAKTDITEIDRTHLIAQVQAIVDKHRGTLELNTQRTSKRRLEELTEILKDTPTMQYETHPFTLLFRSIAQGAGTYTSLVFAFGMIPFVINGTGCDDFFATVAAGTVYYFSNICFTEAFKTAGDRLRRAAARWNEARGESIIDILATILGLGTGGLASGTAAYQTSGPAPGGLLGDILSVLTGTKTELISSISGVNAGGENSLGGISLWGSILSGGRSACIWLSNYLGSGDGKWQEFNTPLLREQRPGWDDSVATYGGP